MRAAPFCLASLLLALVPACRPPVGAGAPEIAFTTTPSGLGFVDLVVGTGASPRTPQVCVVEVYGWLEEQGQKGRVILDTRKRGYPATFPLGVGRVIKGWDEGLATMKKGGKRLLRVPPALGYSAWEAGSDIPAGATLLFELELVEIR